MVAAMSQASKQLLAGARNKKGRLGEGSYPVSLEVHVNGDVLVGAASDGEERDVVAFNDSQLLAALVAGMEPADRTKALTAAVAKLGKARSGTRGAEKAATELVECAAWTSGTAESIAKKRGLTEAKVVGARAGAVTGKPSVTVSAKVRGHAVNLTVDASSDAD
ncbi:MAG: hypothetical protein KDA05_12355 [Phycisphaerales bacterium]|nr:hypothetical protein [Phycisphaerales bacterium]